MIEIQIGTNTHETSLKRILAVHYLLQTLMLTVNSDIAWANAGESYTVMAP